MDKLPQTVFSWDKLEDTCMTWFEARTKLSHFGALVLSWFWSEYALDNGFRHGIESWAVGLHPLLRGLFGLLISFFMWYRNPARKES